jgi:hypothetical protein
MTWLFKRDHISLRERAWLDTEDALRLATLNEADDLFIRVERHTASAVSLSDRLADPRATLDL